MSSRRIQLPWREKVVKGVGERERERMEMVDGKGTLECGNRERERERVSEAVGSSSAVENAKYGGGREREREAQCL